MKQAPAISLGRLVLIGTAVCALAEACYHLVFKIFNGYGFVQSVQEALFSVLALTIVGGIQSFLVSFQIKTKRTGVLIMIIIAILFIIWGVKRLFGILP